MSIPVLVITGMDFPPYSYRGATQNIQPIQAMTQLKRTVNGLLTDVADPMFKKYFSVITANDQQTPEFLWPGAQCVVDCILEFVYRTLGGSPSRPVVPGSLRVQEDHTFYRPRLTMRVVGHSLNHDEWGRQIGWTLSLEEI